MIDYYVMTIPEMIGLYQGLELQAMLRGSSLRWLPYLFSVVGGMMIIKQSTLATLSSHDRTGGGWVVSLFLYGAWVLLLLALFWPEASMFGRGRTLDPSQVGSYTAKEDPQATVRTAADTEDVVPGHVLESAGFRLVLPLLIDTPLAVARTLNPKMHQSFRPLQSISWYLGLSLTGEPARSLTDWVEACYKPVMTTDQEFQQAISSRDLLPWGDTPIAQALATRETIPGAATGGRYLRTTRPLGVFFLSNPDSPRAVKCDVYLRAVEIDVQAWLFEEKSPNGTPLSQVFFEDFGRTVAEQAQWLIYREILEAIGRPAPTPSLSGHYAGLTALTAVSGAASGAASAARGGALGAFVGGLFGAGQAGLNQFTQVVATLTWAVGLAMWFIYWAPNIFGNALLVLVGLFPLALCYMIVPFAGFKPILQYFVALAYVLCAPLWFALVDLWARNAMAVASQSQDPVLSLFNWAPQQVAAAQAIVTGLFVVFVVGPSILFFAFRGVAHWIRA